MVNKAKVSSRRTETSFKGSSQRYPRLTDWVEAQIGETLNFYRLPRQHHKHLKSTNLLERLNEENQGFCCKGLGSRARIRWVDLVTRPIRTPCGSAASARPRRPSPSIAPVPCGAHA